MNATRQRTDQKDFWKFTDEEMETAKNTDLPDLLEHLGYHLKREGRYYRTREMDSLIIKNRRTWKRYSNGKGGDAITFLQEFEGKEFREAVDYLLEFNGRIAPAISRPRAPPEEEKPVEFALPPANGDNCRVFGCVVAKSALLRSRLRRELRSLPCSSFSHRTRFAGLRWEPFNKRGIAPQVIRAFLNTGLLYEDEKYHNAVFVGRDGDGVPRFACKRGTYDRDGGSFKRDVLGSDKSVAFLIPCDPAIPWVLVFEAPIDASGRNPFRSVSAFRRKLRFIPLPLLSPQSLKGGFAGPPLGRSPVRIKMGPPPQPSEAVAVGKGGAAK